MGQMNDGGECLMCDKGLDCESPEDLDKCCTDCRETVLFDLAEMRRMRWERD